ncbi:(d)CMP kinase [Aneurinibacillus aneurinilyticus]|jgi:cytidylate kinase|uniref:Cytidylate kinase n=2 Tax=Aneurinibacillus aneurinilyticus TaxID=1391 RepID=A0A848CS98_ANEAE|nr:(d)CMP kinase [Aneurinibacillus aneurinilyticus]ERI10100.1 cytidylate kinase [Aneurinibacillus aneurinilyticus ATCC 12856]MCI1692995.1 (d)CMP kinase [Aneurinibacillus aneurinilyticus]MED0669889.1 (d)CMP kinase [Aneurinibacillus aneurinilyticus]MED0708058.1 (d)CMP kinase [Aneurinibacillus aneurinilyticus]MED0726068.1 (d)CMP kinase [Aneurinibacillus aneurinilyticus]
MKIAIDGPAGAGKSTVAQQVAKRLGILYVDTGAMYRAVTLTALVRGCSIEDEHSLREMLDAIDLMLEIKNGVQHVYVDDKDVSEAIRSREVTRHVSTVAAYPLVRERLVDMQRRIASHKDVVMDGRDIGTSVLPDAEVKIFLTASIEERARRRMEEFEKKGVHADYAELLRDIEERDRKDSKRAIAPLKQAEDAIRLDTTGRSIDEVVDRIVTLYREKIGERA